MDYELLNELVMIWANNALNPWTQFTYKRRL